MKDQRIRIWKGCEKSIAIAINTFSDSFDPYSIQSTKHSLFSLLDECVEPAWREFLQNQPTSMPIRIAIGLPPMSSIVRSEGGFRELETSFKRLIFWTKDTNLIATLESLGELALACRLKRPKKLTEERRTDRRPEEVCLWCGENTELFNSKQQIYKEGYHPDLDNVSLSAKFCFDHRPKYIGSKNINPRYLSALNNSKDFEKEFIRLELQCSSISEARAQSGDPDLDHFYLRIIAAKATFGDEESALKNEARKLIDKRIDDTKKRIIMLTAKGKTQDEISSLVGMNSRQAVSKALASVPSEYRFDRPKKSGQSFKTTANRLLIEQVTNGLGELVVSALSDPNTYEVYLNCDGNLWVEMAQNESHKIGTIPSEQADKLVRCMARSQNIELSEKNPIGSGDLPINDARFTVLISPVVENPSFCIRKRRS